MPNLKENLLTEFRIPEINGDRCVHAHIETATCKACVTACPENAWILDDELLGLNTDACDGCGLCVPACSEGAILQIQSCTIREDDKEKVLLLGCENTGLNEANCKCIHALSAAELLKLSRDGIHQIYASTGDCKACSRGKNVKLFERIIHINKMLRNAHLQPMHYSELSAPRWQELWKKPEKSVPGPEMSRRTFFRSAIKQTVDMVMHQSTFDNAGEFIPLGQILAFTQTNDTAIYPAVPQINSKKCNGCDACMRACPHEVIQFHQDNDQTCYSIDASACTACNICSDICDENAINVKQWATQLAGLVALITQQCGSCGTVFHSPQKADNEKSLCQICNKVNHQRNLFQVME